METPDFIRKKIDRLLSEKGISYAQASKFIGRGVAYIQQYIKSGSPVRLNDLNRRDLARLLEVDEQELTDIQLKSGSLKLDSKLLAEVINSIEIWLLENRKKLGPEKKAELISLIYTELLNIPQEQKKAKIIDFIKVYETIKKVD